MKRPVLILISQVLLLGFGLFFPILFVRYNGHAAFGVVALAATYSALIVSVVVNGLSQAILSHGLAIRRLRLYALALCLGGALAWLAQVLLAPGASVYLAIVPVLAAQTGVSFVYYYAIRRRMLVILTAILPAEALMRIAVLFGLHLLHLTGDVVLIGCYVLSNVVVCLAALALVRGEDPDAGAGLQVKVAGRFMRWAASGTLIDGFDRGVYGATLHATARSPFLFFDTLYLTAFGLIANTTRLEVLAAPKGGRVASRISLLLVVAVGLAAAALATWLTFALGGVIGRWTGFDPRPVAGAVLFAFAYRAALFVQFASYSYIERGGLTERSTVTRVIGSLALLALIAAPPAWLAPGSFAVAAVVAVISLWLAIVATGRVSADPAAGDQGP